MFLKRHNNLGFKSKDTLIKCQEKTNGDQPIGIGLTTKQMKRKKPIGNTYLLDIEPISDNQKKLLIHMQRENILSLMEQQVREKHLFHYIMPLLMY